ncbi:porin family protein [Hymenobacter tibetensis]|uniref:Porin family protein n=1 Tax=Hymenobacter tibetensis TaxID=497967 RepID=A0ABY4CV98_9BACT|nr:porin family protein [Hymenobacter tibetensis]UOG74113.1 porin family protein [Hymenobacter tibetensis]
MPTPNMSDEELDELVRRSAEAYPEEIPLGGWLRMEDKLQAAATDRLVRQKVLRLFAVELAVVALLLLLWQGYKASNRINEVAQQPNNTAASIHKQPASSSKQQASTQRLAASTSDIASASLLSSSSTKSSLPAADRPTLSVAETSHRPLLIEMPLGAGSRRQVGATAVFHSEVALHKRQKVASNVERQLGATPSASLLEKEGTEATSRQETTYASSPKSLVVVPSLAVIPETFSSQPSELSPQAATLPAGPTGRQDTLAQQPLPSPSDSVARPQAKPARPTHRLLIGLLVAPSFSAVRRLETTGFGNDVGVRLEYRLTSRLRVRTGLTRSVKRYAVASTDYTIPASWTWRQGEYNVNADCRITEIPVDLRYDVVARPTYSVFASVGLTSLLMRYECYDYDFQVNGQTRTAVEKVFNGSNHTFGLLNLSGGVERALGSRWSVQAEPFLQLPLGEVGAGKVRLSSAGAAFSLKYGLLR